MRNDEKLGLLAVIAAAIVLTLFFFFAGYVNGYRDGKQAAANQICLAAGYQYGARYMPGEAGWECVELIPLRRAQ